MNTFDWCLLCAAVYALVGVGVRWLMQQVMYPFYVESTAEKVVDVVLWPVVLTVFLYRSTRGNR